MKARFQRPTAAIQFLAAFLLAATAGRAQTADEETSTAAHRRGTVTASVLNVRARPAKHFERIGQFAQGDDVKVVGETAEWYEVCVPPDTRAWIASKFVTDDGVVTGDDVRIHSGPGLVFTTFGRVHKGDTVGFMGPPVDGWQQIRAPQDATAWVSKAYVRVEDPPPPPAPDAEELAAATDAQESTTPAAPAEEADTTAVETTEPVPATENDKDAVTPPAQPEGQEAVANARAATAPEQTADTEQANTETAAAAEDTAGTEQKDADTDRGITADTPEDEPGLPTRDWQKVTLLPKENRPAANDHEKDAEPSADTPTESTPAAHPQEEPEEKTKSPEQAESQETAPADEEQTTTAPETQPEKTAGESQLTDTHENGTPDAETDPQAVPDTETPDVTVEKSGDETQETEQVDIDLDAEPALEPGAPIESASPLIMREGLLLSLGDQASEQATHVLCLRVQYTAFPLCYLRSSRIDLTDWERREVRVYGKQHVYEGWEKPVVVVTSIQIKQSE